MDTNIIWRDIKKIRANYIRKLPDKIKACTTISRNNFLDILMPNLKIVMKNNTNSTENIGNLSKETGAEMFLLLNLCPSFYARLYRKVIYKGKITPALVLTNKNKDKIKLQSKIIMISAKILDKAKDNFKVKAIKILSKITSVLGINHISPHHGEKESSELDIYFKNNMLLIKG